jgi:hypothetical protein
MGRAAMGKVLNKMESARESLRPCSRRHERAEPRCSAPPERSATSGIPADSARRCRAQVVADSRQNSLIEAAFWSIFDCRAALITVSLAPAIVTGRGRPRFVGYAESSPQVRATSSVPGSIGLAATHSSRALRRRVPQSRVAEQLLHTSTRTHATACRVVGAAHRRGDPLQSVHIRVCHPGKAR